MELFVSDHPLISQKVTLLRNRNTPSSEFRQLVEQLVTLVAFEATRKLPFAEVDVLTPLTLTKGLRLASPPPLVIPILRAGLGMLTGITKLLPDAEIGFLGIRRNEETLQPETYSNQLPDNLIGRKVIIVDPMLATGGTLTAALDFAFERGASDAICICLLAAPEGVDRVSQHLGSRWSKRPVSIFLAAQDDGLTQAGFITPGLGDAGDRLYGTIE